MTGELSADHVYLNTTEFSSMPNVNQSIISTVTYDDHYSSYDTNGQSIIRVSITKTSPELTLGISNPSFQDTIAPRYLLSVIHPPGQVPITERDFDWQTTRETKWLYGNIATTTKIKTASRLGAPIPVLLWQLKRVNLRLSSFSSNAEGSTRLLCDLCSKFQIFSPRENHHLRNQGCSMCLQKVNLIDTTCLVSL